MVKFINFVIPLKIAKIRRTVLEAEKLDKMPLRNYLTSVPEFSLPPPAQFCAAVAIKQAQERSRLMVLMWCVSCKSGTSDILPTCDGYVTLSYDVIVSI